MVPSSVNFEVVSVSEDQASIALRLPAGLLPHFQSFLQFLCEFSSSLQSSITYEKNLADARKKEFKAINEQVIKQRNNAVYLHYKGYRETGLDHRKAVRETKNHFPALDCTSINFILQSLKKSGAITSVR